MSRIPRANAVIVKASNGRAIQAPASIWLTELIGSMTPQQRDALFQRVENRMSALILTPAIADGGRMLLKKSLEV